MNPSEKNDALIISEAVRLVNEGVEVIFPVKGRSMLPFIIGGVESVLLTRPLDMKPFDVVLAYADNCHYVVHRILSMDEDRVVLMGDGNIAGREYCKREDICAKVTHVVGKNGRKRSLDAPFRRFAQKMWFKLLPVRRYLLKFYKLYLLLKKF